MLLVPVLLAKVVHCVTLVEVTVTLDTSVILMEASLMDQDLFWNASETFRNLEDIERYCL